jgi:hypothetical protein
VPNDFGLNIFFDPTQTISPRTAKSAFTCAAARAPMANAYGTRAKSGRYYICNNLNDFKNKFGWSEDFLTYELCGVAHLFFNAFGVKPLAVASALDVENDDHAATERAAVVLTQRFGRAKATTLARFGILPETVAVNLTDTNGEPIGDELELGTDYTLGINEAGYSFIRPVLGGAIFPANPDAEEVTVSVGYDYANPDGVTQLSVMNAIQSVKDVYPKLHEVPQLLIAPGWSRSAAVSDALYAASVNINGVFNANSIVDIDSTANGARGWEDVGEAKDKNGQSEPTQKTCWPCRRLDETHVVHYSSVIAGLVNSIEADVGAPAQTESNHTLPGTGFCLEDGTDVALSIDEANALRGYGVTTGYFWDGADRAWGAYSGAYPSTTDPADSFWTTNRFLRWYGNNLVLTWFQKVDQNITRRLVDMIISTENDRLRNYAANGWCPVGEIFFPEELNTDAQLAAGHIVFLCKPSAYLPAQRIDFRLEFYLQAFFNELRGAAA